MKIQTGDKVKVIAWKDKGKEGKIVKAMPKENKVIVEGINIATKHVKKQGTNPGRIIQVEQPLASCKVMLLDPQTGKPTRVGIKREAGKKVRIAKISGKAI